jgi:hypothetical protein
MKKSQLKQLIGSTLREIIAEYRGDELEAYADQQWAKNDAERKEKRKKSSSNAGKETENEKLLNMKIKNPDTGEDIKLKSALSYKKDTQVYKAAKTAHDKAVDIVADKPKKKTAKKKAAPAKKKDVDWKDLPAGPERQKALSDKITQDAKDAVKARKERHARGEFEDWEKSDEDRIKDRETAKEKINQIPKEKLKKFQDADQDFSNAWDKAVKDTELKYGRIHGYGADGEFAASAFQSIKPREDDYAPKGHEDEYGEYRDLKNKANFRSSDEEKAEKRAEQERQEAEKEKAKNDLHGNDWHDSKAEKLSGLDTDGEPSADNTYSDMMKKSHSEIDKGNITKDTLPAKRLKGYGDNYDFARKEYDRIVDKAWNKDKEATRDSLINRIYDVNDSPEAKELMKKANSGDATSEDKQRIKDMTSTGLDDVEYMKKKVGEENLMHHMKRIKKERDYEKKSGVGKFFSKLGLNEEDIKNPPKLKDLIKR